MTTMTVYSTSKIFIKSALQPRIQFPKFTLARNSIYLLTVKMPAVGFLLQMQLCAFVTFMCEAIGCVVLNRLPVYSVLTPETPEMQGER